MSKCKNCQVLEDEIAKMKQVCQVVNMAKNIVLEKNKAFENEVEKLKQSVIDCANISLEDVRANQALAELLERAKEIIQEEVSIADSDTSWGSSKEDNKWLSDYKSLKAEKK